MRVGIFHIGSRDDRNFIGSLAARVAKQTMPDVEVCHLTDSQTPMLVGADRAVRMERNVPMAVFRMQHHQADGEWLFIDTDVLIHSDIQDVFKDSFDIAIASRVNGDGAHGPAYAEMPHNMGVVFSRNSEFWKAVEKELKTYDNKLQEWMGDQLAVCRLIKRNEFNTKIIPGEKYNFPPFRPYDTNNASIVHYKGPRKPWMVEHAQYLLNETEVQVA